jgi:D-amino-acid dehydrogenase
MHIAVLGAGITGSTTAFALAEKGFDVTVIDRNRYSGMDTSFANGGQLSACNAETWHHPSTLIKGIKWLFDPQAPLSINLKPSWHKYSWLGEFLWSMRTYRENTIETVRLAIEARDKLTHMATSGGFQFDRVDRGMMHVCRTWSGFDHGLKVNELLKQGGLHRRTLSNDEIKQIEPTLSGDFVGGFYSESDFTGDIHQYCRGLEMANQNRGVRYLFDTHIKSLKPGQMIEINTTDGRSLAFDSVVVCAGIGSREIAAQLGDRVNVYPVKGYSITVNLDDRAAEEAAPWVSLNDDDAKIVTSRLGANRFRVAGTAEFNGFNKDIRADRVDPLIAWTRRLFPRINTDNVVPWAGLRPMMPDMMPRVTSGKHGNVFYNTGHGHLGWTMSAVTAYMVAEIVDKAGENITPALAH